MPPQTGTLGWCLPIRTHHGDIHLFQSQRPSQKPNRFPWFKLCPSQGPRPVWSFYSQISEPRVQGRPWQYARVPGRGQSCYSHRVHPRADMCVSVGAAPPGLGGVAGGRPSVPRLAIQMAPFTKLLLLCPCRSLRLVFPGPFFKTGGKEEAPGGPPQLLCSSLVGRGQRFSRAWSSGPHLELCQRPPRLGLGRETASPLQAFAQAVPAACCTLPPWCHWQTLASPMSPCHLSLTSAGSELPSP